MRAILQAASRTSLALTLTLAALVLVPVASAGAANATLTITLSGTGSGTVTSNASGVNGHKIACANLGSPGGPGTGTCAEEYASSTAVKLTATAAVHPALFQGWSGGALAGSCKTGTTNPCEVSVTQFTGAINAAFRAPPHAPTVTTEGTSAGPVPYTLIMHGQINPEGETVESCRFEYDTAPYVSPGEAAHGNSIPCTQSSGEIGSGATNTPISAETEPLQAGTLYHFRLLASNPGGVVTGAESTFTGAAFGGGECNEARRSEQGISSILLPSCMALEMVSPPQKGGQPAKTPTVSADGERVLFHSAAALAGTPSLLKISGDPYVATRTPTGWATDYTAQPGIFRGWYTSAEALSFTPDLSSWLRVGGTSTQYYRGAGQVFTGGLGEPNTAISPLFEAVHAGERETLGNSKLQGASEDHSHLYFTPGKVGAGVQVPFAFLPGDPEPSGTGAESNVYIAEPDAGGDPSLALMARDAVGKVWGGACGAHLGGATTRGAVSADGARTYFSTRPGQPATGACQGETDKLRILERLEGGGGPWIGEAITPECTRVSPACSTADGNDVYQAASVDQHLLYLTTTRQLTSSDTDSTNDLYLRDSSLPAGRQLIQVSSGIVAPGHPTPGAGAEVIEGDTTVSGDGSHVYFVAKGVLTTDTSPRGLTAVAGQPNLYVWDREGEALQFIGTLESADGGAAAYPAPLTGENSAGEAVGGDGHIVLLSSKAKLSADDNDGGFRDIYRYDADTQEIELLSKPEAGVGGSEAIDVETRTGVGGLGGTDFAEQGRWASEDGQTVVFKTAQKLVFGDSNGITDSYIWREGKLARLPGTADPTGKSLNDLPVLSHDGSTVAFQSYKQLLPEDGDAATDVYVARVDGGYPFPVATQPCDPLVQGACQGEPQAAPSAPGAASESITGPGNPPQPPAPKCPKGKRKVRKHGKTHCLARHPQKRHHHRKRHDRAANADRGPRK